MFWVFIGLGSGALISLALSFLLGFLNDTGGHHSEGISTEVDSGMSGEIGAAGDAGHFVDMTHGQIDSSPANDPGASSIQHLDQVYNGPGPVSFQTVSSFFVAFGYTGALLLTRGVPLFFTFSLSGLAGLLFGTAVFKIIKFFWKQQSDSIIKNAYLIGIDGVVITRIPPGGIGEIIIEYGNQPLSLLARSLEEAELSVDTKIMIVDFDEKGIALVSEEH